MASNMPMPLPPRTPTPPPDEDAPQQPVGLGFEGELSTRGLGFDPNALSPMSATFPQYATLKPSDSVSQRATPATLYTPASATFPYTPASAMSGTDTDAPSMSGSENTQNPFNFQSVTYQPGRPQAKQNVRRSVTAINTMLILVGHWKKTRPQVQAQQCLSPDFP